MTNGILKNFWEKDPKKWIYQSIFEIIILGLIFLLLTFFINSKINPNPEIKIYCYGEVNKSIVVVLDNPSTAPGEEVNLMLKIPYRRAGSSYLDNELCLVERHPLLLDSTTKILCHYIPPKSKTAIRLSTDNETEYVYYSLWGKTTPKTNFANLNCNNELTTEIRKLMGEL